MSGYCPSTLYLCAVPLDRKITKHNSWMDPGRRLTSSSSFKITALKSMPQFPAGASFVMTNVSEVSVHLNGFVIEQHYTLMYL